MTDRARSKIVCRQLFDLDNAYLPPPLPRETSYSWCARFHRLNTSATARATGRLLFDSSVAGFRHDFPTHLDILSETTSYHLGSIEDIVYGRTPFAIFATFLPAQSTGAIIDGMRNSGHSRIKYHLGALPSRAGVTAPLKACPSCMHADKISSGVAWWHVEHQWPAVMTCREHGAPLLVATQEFHSRCLKDWFLPTDLKPANWWKPNTLDEKTVARLRTISEWGLRLAERYNHPFDSELLRLAYHLRCKSIGWTSMDGSLKFNEIRVALRDAYSCLEDLPGFTFIRDTCHEHGGFVGSLLRQFVGNKYPLKHVIMMEFLFGSPDTFFAEYERVFSASSKLDKSELWAELTESRNQLKLLVGEAGYSVNSASKRLGLPVGQALRFLRQEGVEYKRRPRVLNLQSESILRQLLESGESQEMIAWMLKIKKSFIRAYLKEHAELRNVWKNAYQNQLLGKYRAHLLQLLSERPGLTMKQMKKIPGNGIQWLLRHDKDWLKGNLPCLWRIN